MGSRAVAGFRVRSGWAAVLVLTGQVDLPTVCFHGLLQLSDAEVAETRQPYHSGRGALEEDEGTIAARTRLISRSTGESVANLLGRVQAIGLTLQGAGIVVGSLNDPMRISNPHIRAHALEGRLFWTLLQADLGRSSVDCRVFLDRKLLERARTSLPVDGRKLADAISELGKTVKPWRLEQKQALLAAWMMLAGASGDPGAC